MESLRLFNVYYIQDDPQPTGLADAHIRLQPFRDTIGSHREFVIRGYFHNINLIEAFIESRGLKFLENAAEGRDRYLLFQLALGIPPNGVGQRRAKEISQNFESRVTRTPCVAGAITHKRIRVVDYEPLSRLQACGKEQFLAPPVFNISRLIRTCVSKKRER